MKEVKQIIKEHSDRIDEETTFKTRQKFMDRWAKLSGVEPDENGKYDHSKIDYGNEFVQLEWWMCDQSILFKLCDDKYREAGLALMPASCRETYYKTGPGNSKPYCEVRMGMSQIRHAIKKVKKAQKSTDTTDVPSDSLEFDENIKDE